MTDESAGGMKALSAGGEIDPPPALIVGRVADTISGQGIAGAVLTLYYDPTGTGAFAGLPARVGGGDEGWFAFHLAPTALLSIGASPVLRVSAVAPGYTGGSGEIAVRADSAGADLAGAGDGTGATDRLSGAPLRVDVGLSPLPVALEGFVYRGGDHDRPVGAAHVEAVEPCGGAADTAADGSFRIAALPVALQVTLRITVAGSHTVFPIHPDFTQRTNRAVFAVP